MSNLVKPHGRGELKPLLLEGDALAATKDRAATLVKFVTASREISNVIMMGMSGCIRFNGFMSKDLTSTPYTYGRLT